MKSIFIINAYPNNSRRLEALKKTLRAMRHPEFDICLSTNYPIKDQEIYDLVDYFIYDKQDIQDYYDYDINYIDGNSWYHKLDWCIMGVKFTSAIHYNVWRCWYNAINLVSKLGYDFFIRTDGDNENITTGDLEELVKIRDNMFEQNKKLFFFQIKVPQGENIFGEFGGELSGGVPSFFVENIQLPYNIEEWVKDGFLVLHSFEIFLYERLKHVLSDIYIGDNDFYMDLRTRINTLSTGVELPMKTFLYFKESDYENVYVFAHNNFKKSVNMEIYLDDDLVFSNFFQPFAWIWNVWKMETIKDKLYKQVLTFEDGHTESKEILMNSYNLGKLRYKHNIVFND